jgi:hypothetical protein
MVSDVHYVTGAAITLIRPIYCTKTAKVEMCTNHHLDRLRQHFRAAGTTRGEAFMIISAFLFSSSAFFLVKLKSPEIELRLLLRLETLY